jgi:hypothetical protein
VVTETFTFNEPVTGFSNSLITLSGAKAGTFTEVDSSHYTLTLTPAIGNSSYKVDVADGSYADLAGNSGAAAEVTHNTSYFPSTIFLGAGNGDLIKPVTVNNQTYYYWDLSGDGTSADTGPQNGGGDWITFNALIPLFAHSITDAAGAAAGTVVDATHHYAWINGVHLSLPTMNGDNPYIYGPNGLYQNWPNLSFQYGTAIANNTTTANPTYDGLLGIWDCFNGTGTAQNVDGIPPAWVHSGYSTPIWSATPSNQGHVALYLNYSGGGEYDAPNTDSNYVVLAVL